MGIAVAMITTWKQRCGIATYTCNLAKALADEDVTVYIVRIPRFGLKEPSIFQNVLERIPLDKIDLIHCQHEYGLYTGLDKGWFPSLRQLGKPLITTMHSVGNWEIDALVDRNSTQVIVHNEFCHKRFTSTFNSSKITVIPHGMTPLKTPLPPKEVCKRRLGIQPEVPIVGYVGYVSMAKGLESLIDAMVNVPNAALLIGGGWFIGDDTQYIMSLKERTLKDLPSRCQWIGFVPEEELPMTYGAMDIVVYPSMYMTESGAMLMALSHGKAVIASDLPPVREKEAKGALATFQNSADLSQKIDALLKKPALRETLEQCAKDFTQENSWANIAKRHTELYQNSLHV